jgi:hypothetical protein
VDIVAATLGGATVARRVFLHIGTMKSGTSYLQTLWWHHRDELARRGLLMPGEARLDHRKAALIVKAPDDLAERLNSHQLGTWERFLAETGATMRDVIISNEGFCAADAARAEETLRQLAGVAEEVHVVLTTRDLGRILPSAWQQAIKHGHSHSFEEYWRRSSSEGPDGPFRRNYDVPEVLNRWTPGLPPERVHIVVHPRRGAGRDWLWQRLCEITGVDPTGLVTDVARNNESLGLPEVEVLRAVNASLPPELRTLDTVRFLKRTLVREVLLPAGGEHFVATPQAHAWALEQGRAAADHLGASGWHIVGQLADLVPTPEPGRTPDEVTSAEVAEVALRSLAHEVLRGLEQQQRIRALREEVRRLRGGRPGE